MNFPLNIKTIKIEAECSKKWLDKLLILFSNLPYNLEKLTVSFENTDNARGWGNFYDETFKKSLTEKLKLPINCELIIDSYVFKNY